MTIRMQEFGRSLVTRSAGRAAYEVISSQMSSGVTVFDFEGVETITNSFADEVFGRMAYEMGMEELRRRTTFKNVSPFWAQVIRSAIDARAMQRPELAAC